MLSNNIDVTKNLIIFTSVSSKSKIRLLIRAFSNIKSKAATQTQRGKLQSGQENGIQGSTGQWKQSEIVQVGDSNQEACSLLLKVLQHATTMSPNCVAQTTRKIKTQELKTYFKCRHKGLEHKNRNTASWCSISSEHWCKYQVQEVSVHRSLRPEGSKIEAPTKSEDNSSGSLITQKLQKILFILCIDREYIKSERMYKREIFAVDKGSLCFCRWKE